MNEILIDWLLDIIGFTIIWICIDYKRTPKIKIFSKEWFILFIGILITGLLIKN